MRKLLLEEVCRGDIGGDLYALSTSDGSCGARAARTERRWSSRRRTAKHFYTRKAPPTLGLRGHKATTTRIVAVGEFGGVFVSTDRAASWEARKVDTEVWLVRRDRRRDRWNLDRG